MRGEKKQIRGKSILIRSSQGTDPAFPTLVCIHGNLGSGRWFEPLLDEYPGTAIAPDMPNFGQSDHIESYTMESYADWISEICVAMDIDQAVIVGHSLGGAVAMELLYRHPKLVSRLILVDSCPVDGLVTPKEHYPIIEAYKSKKSVLTQALKAVVPQLEDEDFFALLVEDAWRMNRDCFIGHAEVLGQVDFREKLGDFGLPVQVLRGALDILITHERAGELADFFDGDLHTFNDCGHSPMVEIPDVFNLYIKEILRRDA